MKNGLQPFRKQSKIIRMREIKFRGKCIDDGKWIIGGYFKNVEEKGEKHYIFDPIYSAVEVIPETVGQFTGLQDKNGKDIYEGDLVKTITGKIMVVKYSDEQAAFFIESMQGSFRYYFTEWKYAIQSEIIGNIHDNPELLSKS